MMSKTLFRISNNKRQMVLQRLGQANKCTSSQSSNNKLHTKERTDLPKNYNEEIGINYNTFRGLHTSIRFHSLFRDNMFNTRSGLANSKAYSTAMSAPLNLEKVQDTNINDLVGKNWNSMSDTEILKNFKILSHHASKTNDSLHSNKYLEILKELSERCSNLEDTALWELLNCLGMWYTPEKLEPIYALLWQAIDKECLKRMPNWSLDQIFMTIKYFNTLRLLRPSNFSYKSLTKIAGKLENLSHIDMVQFVSFLNVSRKVHVNMYEMEHKFETIFNKLTIEEAGEISCFFFKYGYIIKSKIFQLQLIESLNENVNIVTDEAMRNILYILGYSNEPNIIEAYKALTLSLKDQVLKRPFKSSAHILEFLQRIRFLDEDLLLILVNRFEAEIKTINVKFLHKIIYTLNLFNYDSSTSSLYSTICNELLDPNRAEEINRHPHILVETVLDMLRINFYPKELLVQIMTPIFIKNLCKDNIFNLKKNYLILHYIIELDHPEYDGPRLMSNILELLLRRFGTNHPKLKLENDKVLKSTPRILPEVKNVCKQVIQCKSGVHEDYLLPYLIRPFIVVCYDQETNKFVSPVEKLSQIPLGQIKYAPDDGKEWIAISIDTFKPILNVPDKVPGITVLEMRHVQRLGYKLITINYRNWEKLSSEEEKKSYIKNILYR